MMSVRCRIKILCTAAAAIVPLLIHAQPLPDFGVMYNNDGDIVYQQANTAQNTTTLNNMLTQLSGTPIKTVMWSIGSGSDILNYPTQVANTFGWRTTSVDNDQEWYARVNFGRAYAQQNYDPTMVVANRVKTMGKYFIPSYRMNDDHFVNTPLDYPLTGSFWLNNQDKTIGTSPVAGYDYSNLLDFARPEVRAYRMAVINEAIDRYTNVMDGFELDFNRVQIFFKPGQAAANAHLITEMVQQVRAKLDQVEAQTGRQMYLFTRIPPAMHNNVWAGLDVNNWINNHLVDVVLPSQLQTLAHDTPISPFVTTAQNANNGVKVMPSLYPRTNTGWKFIARPNSTSYTGADNGRQVDAEQLRAAASNYRHLGAGGFQMYNFGLPLENEWLTAADSLSSPTPTLGKDRIFAITPAYFTDQEDTFSNAKQIPKTIATSTTTNFTMLMGDNVNTMIRERPDDVIVRIGLTNTPANASITLKLNGQTLHSGAMSGKHFGVATPVTTDGPAAYFQTTVGDLRMLMQGTNTISITNAGGSSSMRITDIQLGVFGATAPGGGAPLQTKREPQTSMLKQVYTDQAGPGMTLSLNNRTPNGYATGGGGVYVMGQAQSSTQNYNHAAMFALDQASYYPSVEGSLASLDYSFWMGKTSGSQPTSFVGLALMQNGQVFTLTDRFSLENGGTLTALTVQDFAVTANDFQLESASGDGLVLNPNVHPDFSSTGEPLYFGFMLSRAGNPMVNGNDMPRTDIDDLILTFNPAAPGWAVDGSGDWNDPANWISPVPNATDAVANFGGAITTPQTVYTNTPVTVGTLRFDNPSSYQISGQGSLTINVSSGAGSIDVLRGDHKINLPLALADSTTINIAENARLKISDPLTFSGLTLTKTGSGTLSFEGPLVVASPAVISSTAGITEALMDLGANITLTISGGNTRLLARQHLRALNVSGGSVTVGSGVTVSTKLLAVSGTGTLDLQDGKMIVDYPAVSPYTGIKSLLASGKLTSSMLSADRVIGFGEASDLYSSFPASLFGESVDSTSVVMALTIPGDATLDGSVNSADFNLLISKYGRTSGARWTQADFTGDGKVNSQDFNVLAGRFGQSMPVGAALGTVVPEPAAVALTLLAGTLSLLRPRRRLSGLLDAG